MTRESELINARRFCQMIRSAATVVPAFDVPSLVARIIFSSQQEALWTLKIAARTWDSLVNKLHAVYSC